MRSVRKESLSRKAFNIFNIVFMILIIIITVFPYLNILAKALNEGTDTARGGILLLPRMFTLENFKSVIVDDAFPRAVLVSVLRVLVGTLTALVVQFMAAYVFTYKELIGRGPLLMFLMIPMYFSGGLIPKYIFYSNTGLLNNYMLYILPTCYSLYNMVIIRSYMNTLPDSLKEAAKLDGATELGILWRIVVPLSKPIMATIALWQAVSLWCDWTTTLYYFTKKDKFTLQYLLVQVLKESQKVQALVNQAYLEGTDAITVGTTVTPESIQCAQIIITTIPIILTYPFLQKYFIQGVTLGAVKD